MSSQSQENKNLPYKDTALCLYQFLSKFHSLGIKKVVDLEKSDGWATFHSRIKDIPDDKENILFSYKNYNEEHENEDWNTKEEFLAVKKPEFEKCPTPPAEIQSWLNNDWDKYKHEASIKEITELKNDIFNNHDKDEQFHDSEKRVFLYNDWIKKRRFWQEKQKSIEKTRHLFKKLHELHILLSDHSDIYELVVSNGFIKSLDNKEINYPILSAKVYTEFDSTKNIIRIYGGDAPCEFKASLFNDLHDINKLAISKAENDIKEKTYHPLDVGDTYGFLKSFINKLSPNGRFINFNEDLPNEGDDKIFIIINPVFHIRSKNDGLSKSIEEIIKDIEHGGEIPSCLQTLIGSRDSYVKEEHKELSIDERLSETSGECVEILFSKDSNKEQLHIAKRIENHDAILVQGPPGTGKSHTIANLLGHFLAQGKRVLVTSSTLKALKVLKEKIPNNLQPLCISALDDGNADMIKSIKQINQYLESSNLDRIDKEIKNAEEIRKETTSNLNKIRHKIFQLMNEEYKSISYNGNGYSPVEIAKFISENKDKLSYIPGTIKESSLLPMTNEELEVLYKSNTEISKAEECELNLNLNNPSNFINTSDFEGLVNLVCKEEEKISQIQEFLTSSKIELLVEDTQDAISIKIRRIDGSYVPLIANANIKNIEKLQDFMVKFNKFDDWMVYIAADGKKGGGYKQGWMELIELISHTYEFSASFAKDRIGKNVDFYQNNQKISTFDKNQEQKILASLEKMKSIVEQKGKLSIINTFFNSDLKTIKEKVRINGAGIESPKDCLLAINTIKLNKKRLDVARQWDNLIGLHGAKKFFELDEEPENRAQKFIPTIEKYLAWHEKDYMEFEKHLKDIGFILEETIKSEELDSEVVAIKKILDFSINILPRYLQLLKSCHEIILIKQKMQLCKIEVLKEDGIRSKFYKDLADAIDKLDIEKYKKTFDEICIIYNKTTLKQKRDYLLNKLKPYAPKWEESIRNRVGIYGEGYIPVNINEAWKLKQFKNIIKNLHSQPYEQLQKDVITLEAELKKQTSELCEYKAWFFLANAIEKDMEIRTALNAFAATVKKIGKGGSKNNSKYLNELKRKMLKCQKAIPAWIMPMSKALEMFSMNGDKFDIVIVDEASQADITSLAIVYLAKKIIIVGDDEQVSPSAMRRNMGEVNNLIKTHLEGKIDNSLFYEASTSLYDLAKIAFRTLTLREHFRCVPDIINFSNTLSYNGEILPLRDVSSSKLQPSVIEHRVDGYRENEKLNTVEAEAIASLIAACMERKEYKNSTFGVISLLGNSQSEHIKTILLDMVEDDLQLEKHKVSFGEPSNFQGDERDVIFLSMVHSREKDKDKQLRIIRYDTKEDKQRYNVAVSRAKDQLWLIHSLDPIKDLKEDDIRRHLIEHVQNPNNYSKKIEQIKKKSDSVFEKEVCLSLVEKGFNVVQQFKVGAYRIDMVACFENKKVAIECDGEEYHSGEEQILQDMERQSIIERVTKFKFIRLRGSEYYLDKEKAVERVISELREYGIYPEQTKSPLIDENIESNNIIEDIKIRAKKILGEWKEKKMEDKAG
ncbi:hypothetical protein BKH43_03930 [Helicobacter sp. 13S00401-1]|uniref:AAA domain-containing protein n=1 Tax=Helicobacter sp. 13S00401-1 TaxID=1905758 RepID=UPI000BDB5676|nr:AAA domain-containing protein [Helicobacter sp. 13S00401-1]PAF50720.1 hypothetical protein BKH43_03930 [Helicobacter sp. 13S00401-1]